MFRWYILMLLFGALLVSLLTASASVSHHRYIIDGMAALARYIESQVSATPSTIDTTGGNNMFDWSRVSMQYLLIMVRFAHGSLVQASSLIEISLSKTYASAETHELLMDNWRTLVRWMAYRTIDALEKLVFVIIWVPIWQLALLVSVSTGVEAALLTLVTSLVLLAIAIYMGMLSEITLCRLLGCCSCCRASRSVGSSASTTHSHYISNYRPTVVVQPAAPSYGSRILRFIWNNILCCPCRLSEPQTVENVQFHQSATHQPTVALELPPQNGISATKNTTHYAP